MVANKSTFANLLVNPEDPISLKRSISLLTEQVDAVIGARGERTLLSEISLVELNNRLINLANTIDTLTTLVSNLNEVSINYGKQLQTLKHLPQNALLDEIYWDFNETCWGSFKGVGEFETVGANLVNCPFAAVAGTTYQVYVQSYGASGDRGIVQRVLFQIPGGALVAYYRTGDTFANALINGWFKYL